MSSRGCYGWTKLNLDKQIVNWSFKVAKNNQKSGRTVTRTNLNSDKQIVNWSLKVAKNNQKLMGKW
jgi:hypothetical protein